MHKPLFTNQVTSTAIKIYSLIRKLMAAGAALLLVACHSHDSDLAALQQPSTQSTYSIGGSISGLNATGLVLQNNAGDNLIIAANSSTFQFATPIAAGGAYSVTVATQPTGQTCGVTNGSGAVGSSNIANVSVTCSINTYTVTSSAGANGSVSPNNSVVINTGANQVFTATPSSNYEVNQWLLDGNVVQTGGTLYQLNNVQANHAVTVTFAVAPPRFAYIGNVNSNNLIKCDVSASTNALSNCAVTGSGFSAPVGIAINSAGTIAYVVNLNNNSIAQCYLDFSTGELNVCTDAGATGLNTPLSITLNAAGTIAYIVNLSGDSVSQCSVNLGTGALSSCVDSGAASLAGPQMLKLNAAGTFAYIPNYNGVGVIKCSVNSSTGALGSCASTGTGFDGPDGMDINSSGTIAYIANYNSNNISKCGIDAVDGTLSGCVTTGSGFNGTENIILNRAGTILYVQNFNVNTVSQCVVNQSTGDLSGCVDSGATGLSSPLGVELYY